MLALGLFVLGFFSGSVLYSALLPRLTKGVDVRALAPDHNPGAANVFKYAGVPVGILALVCDLAKAYVPVRLALRWLPLADPAFALVLCAPVLGHAFSPFAHFRGGKAIAASFGALLALLPGCTVVLPLSSSAPMRCAPSSPLCWWPPQRPGSPSFRCAWAWCSSRRP